MKTILSILLILSAIDYSTAQDVQFSQFFSSSIFINPAFAGLEPTSSLKINHKKNERAQDGSIQELSQFTFIYPLSKTAVTSPQLGGIGFTVSDERLGFQGIFQSTKILTTGAYVISFDSKGLKRLSFGLQGGLIQQKLNFNNIQSGSQYNPYFGYDDTLPSEFSSDGPRFYPIINTGIVYSMTDHHNPYLQQNSFIIGISADYLNRPNTGKVQGTGAPLILKGITSVRLKLTQNLFIHPSALIIRRSKQSQINTGVYLSKYVDKGLTTLLQVGGWYRLNDSFIALMGIQYKEIKIGCSIDTNSTSININEVVSAGKAKNSFEISLSYSFRASNSVIRINNPLF